MIALSDDAQMTLPGLPAESDEHKRARIAAASAEPEADDHHCDSDCYALDSGCRRMRVA